MTMESLLPCQQGSHLAWPQWRLPHRELPHRELPHRELPHRELPHRELPHRGLLPHWGYRLSGGYLTGGCLKYHNANQ